MMAYFQVRFTSESVHLSPVKDKQLQHGKTRTQKHISTHHTIVKSQTEHHDQYSSIHCDHGHQWHIRKYFTLQLDKGDNCSQDTLNH